MYTDDRNAQVVLALLKAYGINVVIASPGATNVSLVGSMQQDSFFTLISAVDERHASYLACGYATQSKRPVVLSCTGATASRNYLPGLTEAYYRKLSVLAITSSQVSSRAENLSPQATIRNAPPPDSVRASFQCPLIYDDAQFSNCELVVNRAIQELFRAGGGPVHLNLETAYPDFTAKSLPAVRKICRHTISMADWPAIDGSQKIIVWIGAHLRFDEDESRALEKFLRSHRALAIVDHTSSYRGYGAVHASLLCSQSLNANPKYSKLKPDLILHIGEISGDYPSMGYLQQTNAPVWRISEDGEIKDVTGHLIRIFECRVETFFRHYTSIPKNGKGDSSYYRDWASADNDVRSKIPSLPFSNLAIARFLAPRIPEGAILQFGILNSLRSWNFFPIESSIETMSNVGGFGIDGCVSTLIGASLAAPDRLCFGVFGDLAFFYDLNALGNRHVGKNLRIILINNGTGAEFNLYCHRASSVGGDVNAFMAAGGHFGQQSQKLVRHFIEDLGLEYRAVHNEGELVEAADWFLSQEGGSRLMECFTQASDESEALWKMEHIDRYEQPKTLKREVSKFVPTSAKRLIKSFLH